MAALVAEGLELGVEGVEGAKTAETAVKTTDSALTNVLLMQSMMPQNIGLKDHQKERIKRHVRKHSYHMSEKIKNSQKKKN